MEFKLKGGMPQPQVPANVPTILIVFGLMLVAFGIFVIVNPEIVAYLIAGVFILIGGLLALAGFRTKRLLG